MTFIQKCLFLVLFLFAASGLSAQQSAKNAAFNKMIDQYYEEAQPLYPLSATQKGDNRFNDILLNDISVPFLKKVHDYNIKYSNKLAAFKRASLNAEDKIAYDIIDFQIRQSLDDEQFHLEYFPFDQRSGLPNSFPSNGSGTGIQPFKTVKDYYNWLKRIDRFPDWVDTAIANFNKGIAIGMVLPQALVVKMIPQMEAQTVTDTAKNIFYGPLNLMPGFFSGADKNLIRTAYHKAISTKIIPAYAKLADYLKNTYLPKARKSSGVNDLPNGAAFYRNRLHLFTTSDKAPAEIYQTGLSEVERISKEIEKQKELIGFKGSIAELFEFMKTDKRFFPFKTDEQVLDSFRAVLPKIQPRLNKLFNLVPKTGFEVKSIEKFKAASASANYQRGAEDGSRPGYFNVPIVDPLKYSSLSLEHLFLHEAIPGHHFQLSLQQENKNLPRIRRFAIYSVFSEGWALYTESLGDELGLYSDPYRKIAAYKSELFRAVRLVVDVSLHTGKMTREDCIKYMVETGGVELQSATSETERYMTNPGQAVSYKTGEMKIKELRARYEQKLGTTFNIKNFHDAVLSGGSMPLTVFETYMDNWAATQ